MLLLPGCLYLAQGASRQPSEALSCGPGQDGGERLVGFARGGRRLVLPEDESAPPPPTHLVHLVVHPAPR